MSFSVNEGPGKRADVAKSIREGIHHKKGEHTQLDMSREFIAEQVEHTGTAESIIACDISGHHYNEGRQFSFSIRVVPPAVVQKVPAEETASDPPKHPEDAGAGDISIAG